MSVLLIVTGMFVIGAVALLSVGKLGRVPEPVPDRRPSASVPEGPLCGETLTEVRFAVGLRGYRMDEVDGFLARVAADLAVRDQVITELRAAAAEHAS